MNQRAWQDMAVTCLIGDGGQRLSNVTHRLTFRGAAQSELHLT